MRNVKETIISTLLPGPLQLSELISIASSASKTSIQACYKATRDLKRKEVVTLHNKQISLSLIWLTKQKERYIFAEYAYKSGKNLIERLSHDRTKLSFKFKNYVELDLFWAHGYTILSEKVTAVRTRYFIIPHDFFSYGRSETDTYWVEGLLKNNLVTRFIVTHMMGSDRIVIKQRKKNIPTFADFLLYQNPLQQDSFVYYNLLGDYIFKATFDKKVNERLETFIAKVKKLPLTKDEEKEIQDILAMKGRFTLIIEKDEKKAESMEKKVRKYFE